MTTYQSYTAEDPGLRVNSHFFETERGVVLVDTRRRQHIQRVRLIDHSRTAQRRFLVLHVRQRRTRQHGPGVQLVGHRWQQQPRLRDELVHQRRVRKPRLRSQLVRHRRKSKHGLR